MKLVFAADLHGDPTHYDALAALVMAERPAALLLGGDLLPKARGSARAQLAFVQGPLAAFVARIGVPVYAIAGNEDWPRAVAALAELPGVRLLTLDPLPLGNCVLQGYPFITPAPFRRQDYVRRDRIRDRVRVVAGAYVTEPAVHEVPAHHLQRLPSMEEHLARLVGGESVIWVTHCPPWGGSLDVLHSGAHVGSRALVQRIERLQPLLTLHGHIHESPAVSGCWAESRGRTISVNPGRGERLHAVVVDTEAPAQTLRHTVYGAYG